MPSWAGIVGACEIVLPSTSKSPLGRALLVSWVALAAGAVWAAVRVRASRRHP